MHFIYACHLLKINRADGQLIIKLPSTFKDLGFSQVILTSIGGDVYRSDRLRMVEFSRNEKNEISGFKFNDVGRMRDIRFVKRLN